MMRKCLPTVAGLTMLVSLTACGNSFSASVCDGLVQISVTSGTIPRLGSPPECQAGISRSGIGTAELIAE